VVARSWDSDLDRWLAADVIDQDTAARIRVFEQTHPQSRAAGWPVWIALASGALMLGAGVLLFVSAHWDSLSPGARFTLVVSVVAVFHLAGGFTAERSPQLSTTLHTVGTVALGAGIYLAGQIFNLDEHWPGGFMLWALGSVVAWALLEQWPQLALTATLVPAWLFSEWSVATSPRVVDLDAASGNVATCGTFLLALAYFTTLRGNQRERWRRTLMWVGGLALLPAALLLIAASDRMWSPHSVPALSKVLLWTGWTVAISLPCAVALVTRGASAWPIVPALLWTIILIGIRSIAGELWLYLWWALGGLALVAWGVRDRRSERINMGSAVFALTIVAFYFSEVMDKLGRSVSLVGFGLLFLAGGWALERVRRRLVLETRRPIR
jgi:uncharacterized membrane protein